MDLATIQRELEAVNSEAIALCSGLDEYELAWRTEPSRWSIAENLVHLRLTAETFLPAVERAITETRRRAILSPGPFHLDAYGRFLAWYVEPPPRIRLPAPKPLRPILTGSPAYALQGFLEYQALIRKQMTLSDGLDLTGPRFPSPLSTFVRMNLLEFFAVFNGHSRRHLWQAANVRAKLIRRRAAGA